MSSDLVVRPESPFSPADSAALPALVAAAGSAAAYAWDEFFAGQVRNHHTRRAYSRAVRQFLAWCEGQGVALHQVMPGQVGRYLDQLRLAIPSKKQHLAALRAFFDALVLRHVVVLNPAASVRAERYSVIEGKTPEISVELARTFLASIQIARPPKTSDGEGEAQPLVVGLRDRAIVAILIYTAVRIGAVASLRRGDLAHDGTQWTLRFAEKRGKSREIPVRHDLEGYLLAWLAAAGLWDAPKDSPLFRTTIRRTKQLTGNAMSAGDMGRVVKRRMKDAGLPLRLSPHSFRAMAITDLLSQGVPLEDVQHLAGHSDPRTTRLYDRRQKKVTRNVVERISV